MNYPEAETKAGGAPTKLNRFQGEETFKHGKEFPQDIIVVMWTGVGLIEQLLNGDNTCSDGCISPSLNLLQYIALFSPLSGAKRGDTLVRSLNGLNHSEQWEFNSSPKIP